MRMTVCEPFSTAAITASLAKLRIDQASVEHAIRRTITDLMAVERHKATLAMINAEAMAEYAEAKLAPPRRVRRAVAKAAISAKFPGTAPERWQDLDAEQLAWFHTWHPGSLELRLGKIDRGQQPINSPAHVVQLLAKYKKRKPFVDKGTYKVDPTRDGLAYVLPYGKGWKWVANNAACSPGELQHRRSAPPQLVIETDPILFDENERAAWRGGHVNPIGPPQVWQTEWRRAHFVKPSKGE